MSTELNTPPSFWSRLRRAFVSILRLLLVLAVIAGIAAAVYFGTPYLYEKFILPVETNTARLSEVESKQAADADRLANQIAGLQTRLGELEKRQTENAQALAKLQGHVQTIGNAVDAHTETLKQLGTMQATLDALSRTSAEHEALLVGGDSALADLQRQVTLSRSIEQLSRARLYLSQSNFGLAKQDVQAARDLLVGLQTGMPADKGTVLQGVIARLDLALGNLPAFPVVAVDDVDIAWQLLIYGPPEVPGATSTPGQTIATATPAADLTPTATP
jgi:hypothetical protein